MLALKSAISSDVGHDQIMFPKIIIRFFHIAIENGVTRTDKRISLANPNWLAQFEERCLTLRFDEQFIFFRY